MSDTNRLVFGSKLQSHDWYFAYSDDHSYWARGQQQRKELDAMHKNLNCPFSFVDLSKWAHNMILEEFAEESPGEWYRQPHESRSVAPTTRGHLMTQSEWSDIQQWFEST